MAQNHVGLAQWPLAWSEIFENAHTGPQSCYSMSLGLTWDHSDLHWTKIDLRTAVGAKCAGFATLFGFGFENRPLETLAESI